MYPIDRIRVARHSHSSGTRTMSPINNEIWQQISELVKEALADSASITIIAIMWVDITGTRGIV